MHRHNVWKSPGARPPDKFDASSRSMQRFAFAGRPRVIRERWQRLSIAESTPTVAVRIYHRACTHQQANKSHIAPRVDVHAVRNIVIRRRVHTLLMRNRAAITIAPHGGDAKPNLSGKKRNDRSSRHQEGQWIKLWCKIQIFCHTVSTAVSDSN